MTTRTITVEALERLPRATCYRAHLQTDEHLGVSGAVWIADAIRALASDAGRSVGALDVERLARALRSGPFAGYTDQRMLDLAQIIAAAYAEDAEWPVEAIVDEITRGVEK